MKKVCAVSGENFEITDADQEFYRKIGTPLPTLCPAERERRRWAWRGKDFFMRACDKCEKVTMSWFSPDIEGLKAYCNDCFESEEFDAMEYGRDFDFDRPFFEQFFEMAREVPRHISNSVLNTNSEYIICAHRNKNCYFTDEMDGSWDCYYGYNIQYCKNIVESIFVRDSEIGYDLRKAEKCYSVFCSQNVFHCNDSAFLMNCKGCRKCLFCANLRNKEYCIFNKQVGKEEFEKAWKEVFTGQVADLERARGKFDDFMKDQVYPSGVLINVEDSSGDYLSHCKNVKDCYWVDHCKDCRYCTDIHNSRDCYDTNIYEGELMYECLHAGPKGYNQQFSQLAWFSSDVSYCIELRTCRDLFGCAGLKHKQYCILNKQYSEKEYFALKDRIVEYMKKTGEYGEFFPIEYSPHPYNFTMAQRFYPLEKAEVSGKGWKWADEKEVVVGKGKAEDVADGVFVCAESSKKFKLLDAEVKFYKQYGLPSPVLAPAVRIDKLWEKMGPRKLFDRKCSKCEVDIQTTFGEDFDRKVYCQESYLGDVW